jgi:hypothetical protein
MVISLVIQIKLQSYSSLTTLLPQLVLPENMVDHANRPGATEAVTINSNQAPQGLLTTCCGARQNAPINNIE